MEYRMDLLTVWCEDDHSISGGQGINSLLVFMNISSLQTKKSQVTLTGISINLVIGREGFEAARNELGTLLYREK
jgi:hypothetical protein